MNAADYKELVNTIFEGLIGLFGLILAGWLINGHPGDTVIVAFANTIAVSILVFFFGQRGQVKAVNGNIAALANIAGQMFANNPTAVPAAAPSSPTPSTPTA